MSLEQPPSLMQRAFELGNILRMSKVEVKGLENLEKLPKDKPIIIVPTHISDLDGPIALGELVGRLDIAVAHISAQLQGTNDLLTRLGIIFLGADNFVPLDFKKENNEWIPLPFNPDNFRKLEEKLKQGKAVMIVAHNPTYDHVLPPRGGLGPVFLAQKAGGALLPVAVSIEINPEDIGKENAGASFTLLKRYLRPRATVSIGEPVSFTPIDDNLFKQFEQVVQKLNRHKKLTEEEREVLKSTHRQLKEQSNQIMRALAAMLPEEKQGVWK